MLYRSISVAMILLLSWFAFTSTQSQRQLSFQINTVKQSMADAAELSAADKLETHKKIGEIQAFITSQNQLGKQKKQVEAKLARQEKFTRFNATYSKVLKAELLRSDSSLPDAAKLLKSTKKEIWAAGDTYPDQQKTLRALMPKIDALVIAWNKGDNKPTAKPVYLALDKIIQQKGK